jgi:hypothetical protein
MWRPHEGEAFCLISMKSERSNVDVWIFVWTEMHEDQWPCSAKQCAESYKYDRCTSSSSYLTNTLYWDSPSPFIWRNSPHWARASSFTRFLDHTQRRTTVGRTRLDEWSARHRDLYLTTHNIHNGQTSMLLVGFEPTISAGEWPQTYALDLAATRTVSEIVSRRKLCTGMSYQIVFF